MEVGSFDHQNVSSPRGGQAVHHGCAMSTMVWVFSIKLTDSYDSDLSPESE